MSMDDRPNASIWGTILSCIEIGLNIYQVVALNGEGLMVKSDDIEDRLGWSVIKGETKDGYVHFDKGSAGEQAAAYELIKRGHITDPEVIEQYGTPEEIEANGEYTDPAYFGSLPEPGGIPDHWGAPKETTPIDNGVYFVAGEHGSGIAVHTKVAFHVMSDYAQDEDFLKLDKYRFYALDKEAAIAVFELSGSHPKVLDLITSWESLMHTLAAEFPDYTQFWNDNSEPEYMITDTPAPSFMFLQRHLDEAAARLPMETEQDEEDMFFEAADFFDREP